jgi:pimeloyl-ACP methyl ester carboxylesterase
MPKIAGRTHDVPVDVVYDPNVILPGVRQLHYYGGLGVETIVTRRAVRTLSRYNLPAVGVILRFTLDPTVANLERTVVEVPQYIAAIFNERVGDRPDTPIDLFGDSQGGAVVLMAASKAPERYGAIAASKPAGFNSDMLGNTLKERRREFYIRFAIRNRRQVEQNVIRDPTNLIVTFEVSKRLFGDAFRMFPPCSHLAGKLNYALGLDLTALPNGFEPLSKLAETHPLAIFAGRTDPLFQVHEYRTTLRRAGLENLLHIMPGSHTSPGNRGGIEQTGPVAVWFHEIRAKEGACRARRTWANATS